MAFFEIEKGVNPTENFLFTTWVNLKKDPINIYIGSDGCYYKKQYGLPFLKETNIDFLMFLAWSYLHRNGCFGIIREQNKTPRCANSKEEQNIKCKALLKM